MKIKAYQDGKFLFECGIVEFLSSNRYDPDLVDAIKELSHKNSVTFNSYHSGDWKLERVNPI